MLKFRSVNDVLDFAIAREIEAHEFYASWAKRVTDAHLRGIIDSVAVDELQHSIRLKAIRDGETAFVGGEVGSLGIAEKLGDAEPHPDMSYRDFLRVAMTQEKAAFRLYTNLALIAKVPEIRAALLGLAQEEAQHKLRLEIEYDWETA